MRNKNLALVIAVTGLLCVGVMGCGKRTDTIDKSKVPDTTENATENATGSATENTAVQTNVTLPGPFGEMKLTLLDGWKYELCEIDSKAAEEKGEGRYGICFYPKNASKGMVYVSYLTPFGVCGTGLDEESIQLAGETADKGTYDNEPYWSYIHFQGDKKDLVAQTYDESTWTSEELKQAETILDTVEWNPEKKTGGAFIDNSESYDDNLMVDISMKNVTATGATVILSRYEDSGNEEITYGEEFRIEKETNGKWQEADVVCEGDYGFKSIAYVLGKDETKDEKLDWEWLYGKLGAGNYRLIKKVQGRELKAYFVLN